MLRMELHPLNSLLVRWVRAFVVQCASAQLCSNTSLHAHSRSLAQEAKRCACWLQKHLPACCHASFKSSLRTG